MKSRAKTCKICDSHVITLNYYGPGQGIWHAVYPAYRLMSRVVTF